MSKPTQDGFEPIAIIGTGAIMPGASDAKAFWQVIYNGEDLITEIPEAYWQTKDYFDPDPKARDKLYCKKGAFIKPIEFDAMEFGITPQNLEATDSSQLLALSATKQVLENVYGDYSKANLDQTGVILGATGPQELILYMAARLDEPIWRQALNDFDYPSQDIDKICQQIKSYYPEWQENTFPGLLSNVIAGRVANRFNLGGTNCAIDAACASALAAIRMAIFELQNHRAEMMIAGGVDSFQSAPMFMCFAKTTALSFSGDCRPFSADADGTVLGEGLCFFALKRLADAERDGDPIYAVIRGMGSSSDGFGKSVYAPDADGQAKAIKRTYQHLDYSTDSIELLEAHGTGTKVGDATEFEGLKKSFSNLRNNVCALGSIKSQIGHSKGTAGAAGLFKAAMALHHKTLPATLKIDAPNPKMDLENSNFYLNTELRPWIRSKQHPRRAGVSAFGFGGSNYHMAIEEYTGKNQPKRYWTSSSELITLTATNKTELLNECESLLQQTNAYAKKPEHLNRIARASQTTIDPQAKIRLAIVANNCDELMVKLNKTIDAIKSNTDLNQLDSQVYFSNSIETGAVAFVFPGQGSQYINMSRDLTLNFPIVREHWDQAENHFLTNDKSLSEVVFPAPSFTKTRNDFNAQLQKTTWTQPALAVCGYAYAKLLQQLDIKPDYCIGHSLGELTALAVADSFDFETLVAMASQRANCMQAAASNTDSGMLAIKYNANKLEKLIIDTKLDATIANYNAPQQVVVSAEKLVLEKLKIELDQRNIRYIALPVAAGFHSRAVASAQTEFLTWLKSQTISQPKIPVIANTTAKLYPQTKAAITKDLSQQLAKPVLFSKSIQTLYDKGVRTFIEVGPKAILSKLIGACLGEQPHLTIAMDNPKKDGNLQLWQLLGKLFSQGININFNKIWQDVEAPKPLPTTNKKRYIVNLSGCNIGKPYPIKQPKSVPTTVAPKLKPIESKPMSKQQPKPNQTATQPVVNLSGQSNLLQQITSAHIAYQQSMARTHEIFLQTMTQLSGSDAVDLTAPMAAPMSIPMPVQAAAVAPAPMVTAAIAPAPMPTITTPPQINPVETPVKTASPEPIQATVTPLKTVTTDSANNNNLKDVLLKVVSEKTGYPTDMLDLDMDLEADLGVDSIKRVEILAAMQEHDSSLPEVDADQMAELNTLNKVLQFLQADNPSTKK